MRRRLGFGLSRELWLVEAGILLNMLGYGAVLPFEIIYLHDGRGFTLGVAGLVVGMVTGIAAVTAPLSGPLIDRLGGGPGIARAPGEPAGRHPGPAGAPAPPPRPARR